MNTIEQLVEALKAVYLTCDWHGDDGKDAMQLANKAIAAGEAELKREPLTDKRIIEIRKSTNTKENTAWADTLAFARAIEKENNYDSANYAKRVS